MALLHRIAHIAAAALSPLKTDAALSWRTFRSGTSTHHRPVPNNDLMLPRGRRFEPAAEAAVQRTADAPPIACLFCLRDDENLNTVIDANETFYARLDNFPATPGHVEIVPKRHVVSFFDLSESEIIDAYTLIRAVEKKLSILHDPGGYTIGVNEGRVAGRSIDHLHIHLIPRYKGDVVDPRGGIRQVVPNFDPDTWGTPTRPSSPAQ
ncbi:MAG: HIT family protein [Pseudonocardiaceae bacterium]